MQLFEFQAEDVDKLRPRRSVLIANEMGTGKTFEAISLDRLHRIDSDWPEKKTLVIAPLTVLPSWEDHFHNIHPELKVVTVDPKNRKKSFEEFLESGDVYLAHWDALRLMPELKEVFWLHIIADECKIVRLNRLEPSRLLKLATRLP